MINKSDDSWDKKIIGWEGLTTLPMITVVCFFTYFIVTH